MSGNSSVDQTINFIIPTFYRNSSRKVASISGDCRRALDIFRRATEISMKDCVGEALVVTTIHVVKAFDEMIQNPKVIAINGCSRYEKLFLQAVGVEVIDIQFISLNFVCIPCLSHLFS